MEGWKFAGVAQAVGATMVILGSAFDWMVMNEHGISGLEWGYGVFTAGVSLLAMVLLLFALLLGRRGMGRAALLCRWAKLRLPCI